MLLLSLQSYKCFIMFYMIFYTNFYVIKINVYIAYVTKHFQFSFEIPQVLIACLLVVACVSIHNARRGCQKHKRQHYLLKFLIHFENTYHSYKLISVYLPPDFDQISSGDEIRKRSLFIILFNSWGSRQTLKP